MPTNERRPGRRQTGGGNNTKRGGRKAPAKPRAAKLTKDKPTCAIVASTAAYDYVGDGEPLFQVRCRRSSDGSKKFTQHAWTGDGWAPKLNDARRVLYRYPDVIAAVERGETIWITEGEKDRLVSLGKVATTNPGGANNGARSSPSASRAQTCGSSSTAIPLADATH